MRAVQVPDGKQCRGVILLSVVCTFEHTLFYCDHMYCFAGDLGYLLLSVTSCLLVPIYSFFALYSFPSFRLHKRHRDCNPTRTCINTYRR